MVKKSFKDNLNDKDNFRRAVEASMQDQRDLLNNVDKRIKEGFEKQFGKLRRIDKPDNIERGLMKTYCNFCHTSTHANTSCPYQLKEKV